MAAAKKVEPFRLPDDAALPEMEQTVVKTLVYSGEMEVFPIDTAPRDKRWIEASADGNVWTRVRFYQTRIRTGAIQWIPVECWTTTDPPKFSGKVEGLTMWRPCGQW